MVSLSAVVVSGDGVVALVVGLGDAVVWSGSCVVVARSGLVGEFSVGCATVVDIQCGMK